MLSAIKYTKCCKMICVSKLSKTTSMFIIPDFEKGLEKIKYKKNYTKAL